MLGLERKPLVMKRVWVGREAATAALWRHQSEQLYEPVGQHYGKERASVIYKASGLHLVKKRDKGLGLGFSALWNHRKDGIWGLGRWENFNVHVINISDNNVIWILWSLFPGTCKKITVGCLPTMLWATCSDVIPFGSGALGPFLLLHGFRWYTW